MATPIAFYFDFSSPYAYLASEQIEALAQRCGRSVDFRPILLGAAFKASGQKPLTEVPLKGDYARHDFARSARYAGVAFRMPEPFPIGTVQAARCCLVLKEQAPALLPTFVHAGFRAYFVEGRNLSDPKVVSEVLTSIGLNADAITTAAADPAIKDALKTQVDEAVARGVFGAPFFLVDGEPFWGNDRLPQLERWLSGGPF
jgi:2-hydroxychromene-2-carboxylate isomerase